MESATVAIWSESFFNKMVACSSEPVGDTFLWLTTSSGFHKFIMSIVGRCDINNIHFIIHKNFIYRIIDLCNYAGTQYRSV